MFFFTTVQAHCQHCFGVGTPGCDGTSDTCTLRTLPVSGAGLVVSCVTAAGFLRILSDSRIEPPTVNVQVTMQVLGTIIRTSRLCLFDWSDIESSRLMRFTRAHPVASTVLTPAARACAYVKGALWPVQVCRRRDYCSFCDEKSRGAHEVEDVYTPLPGVWTRLWLEAVARQRDIASGGVHPPSMNGVPLIPPTTDEGFVEVSLLFFKYILILGLTDHVDLAAFFSFVISPHLPGGTRGQEWYFSYSLMVVCLQTMDTSHHTSFMPICSDPSGQACCKK